MRMRVVVAAAALIAMALVMWATAATARDADSMTLEEFRALPESARIFVVLGAITVTSKLALECPAQIPVAEWQAALMHRALDVKRPWIDYLFMLMDERACRGATVKADT